MADQKIRFAAIGLNHNHIYAQTDLLLRAGGEKGSIRAHRPGPLADAAPGDRAAPANSSSRRGHIAAGVPSDHFGTGTKKMVDGMRPPPGMSLPPP